METLDLKFSQLDVAAEQGTFSGYLSVFGNLDLGGDVVEPGAFKRTLNSLEAGGRKLPILWQHNTEQPIGVFAKAVEDTQGLYVEGQLNLEVQQGREAYALLKQGALTGMSIGYKAIKDAWEGGVRKLLEIKLYEGSLVTFPMNEAARVSGVKAGRILSAKNRALVESAREAMQNASDALSALLEAADPVDSVSTGKADPERPATEPEVVAVEPDWVQVAEAIKLEAAMASIARAMRAGD